MVAKKAAAVAKEAAPVEDPTLPRPRLHKLTVRNFRAIGTVPVTIELDDIVVLVGPNNSGKSSILRAYELVMQHGSKEGDLLLEDFPDSKVNDEHPVEIELETVVYDEKAPGAKWIRKDEVTGEMFVREKWTWRQPGKPKKVGWDVAKGDWDEKEGPWGAPGVAQPARPEPHRILAFDSPEKQAESVIKLLKDVLNQRIKDLQSQEPGTEGEEAKEKSDYARLLDSIASFQEMAVQEANEEIEKVEKDLTALISRVFPGHVVKFDARLDADLESSLNFFKETPRLLMGPMDGYQPTVDRQGSGARRTLLWAALRLVSEQNRAKKDASSARPHLLLMDEPELCLHPDAIREACKVLYDLPKNGNWQVMVTTHSPVFIDLWRDNTSIVRVERKADGQASGTTIYRPAKARLTDDDKENLKLLNLCDPYVAEFFFGGKTILVEGDTEFTAFTFVIQNAPEEFKNLHVVRARGKATIRSLCKILNQFNADYSILHDSDLPTAQRDGVTITNPAWTLNGRILEEVEGQVTANKVRLLASLPNFELAYFGKEAKAEKPVTAWERLKASTQAQERVSALLSCLSDPAAAAPEGAIAWTALDQIEQALRLKGYVE